jgi:hypothetical protein
MEMRWDARHHVDVVRYYGKLLDLEVSRPDNSMVGGFCCFLLRWRIIQFFQPVPPTAGGRASRKNC